MESNFYTRVEELLFKHRRTFADLGREIGVTGAATTGWKKGALPRVDVALKIAEYLDTTVEYLMTGRKSEMVVSKADEDLLNLYHRIRKDCRSMVLSFAQQLSESPIAGIFGNAEVVEVKCDPEGE